MGFAFDEIGGFLRKNSAMAHEELAF